MTARLFAFFLAVASIYLPHSVMGAPILFEHWGEGTGTLGGVNFSGPFKITAIGDTNNREYAPFDPVVWINHTSAKIQILGWGEFQFTTPTRTFSHFGKGSVGFSRAIGDGSDLFDGPLDHPPLQGWMMGTSTPEQIGNGMLIQWTSVPMISTSSGQLIMNTDFSVASRFRATVVPEPSCVLLSLATGIVLYLRQRSKSDSLA